MNMNENKVNDLIEGSLAKIRELTGTETVVGDPIYTPNGTLILPVSKISMGFATIFFRLKNCCDLQCGGGSD